ncbi:MAG: hypothetical protein WD096_08955 [Actinomycetota bacterium]
MRRAFPVLLLAAAVLWPASARAQATEDPAPAEQVVLSGDVVVAKGTVVGEIVVIHGSVTVRGVAAGDVVVLDGPIVIWGQVRGSVVALDGDIRLQPSAQVAGDVLAGGELIRDDGSTVTGQIRTGFRVTLSGPVAALGALLVSIAMAFSTLLAVALLLVLAPRGAERIAQAARSAVLASAGWGLVLGVAIPTIAVLAAATVVGIPFGLSMLLGLGLIWFVGQAWATWIVGRMLVREPRSRVGALFAGWAVVAAVGLVPVLNVVWWTLGSLFGLGAMTVASWRARGTSKHRIGAAPPPPPAGAVTPGRA